MTEEKPTKEQKTLNILADDDRKRYPEKYYRLTWNEFIQQVHKAQDIGSWNSLYEWIIDQTLIEHSGEPRTVTRDMRKGNEPYRMKMEPHIESKNSQQSPAPKVVTREQVDAAIEKFEHDGSDPFSPDDAGVIRISDIPAFLADLDIEVKEKK